MFLTDAVSQPWPVKIRTVKMVRVRVSVRLRGGGWICCWGYNGVPDLTVLTFRILTVRILTCMAPFRNSAAIWNSKWLQKWIKILLLCSCTYYRSIVLYCWATRRCGLRRSIVYLIANKRFNNWTFWLNAGWYFIADFNLLVCTLNLCNVNLW